MKQWMIPVVTVVVGAGMVAGVIVGLTRPWQSEERIPVYTPTPQAAFTEADITQLAQRQVAERAAFPAGTKTLSCVSASFKPAADMWVVTCNFYSDQESMQILQTRLYTLSDKDGKLVQ